MNDLELRRRLRDLSAQREPERDLWPAIAARIAATPQSAPMGQTAVKTRWRYRTWFALAASIAVAAVLASRWQDMRDAPWNVPVVAESSMAKPTEMSLATADLRLAEAVLTREYAAALASFDGERLPPGLAPVAAELDSHLLQIRTALRQDPNAPFLLERLQRTYMHRLRLSRLALST